MPAKQTVLPPTDFDDFYSLYKHLRQMRDVLSRAQVETLADVAEYRLPAAIKLEQRTPKGATYLHAGDVYIGYVSNRGKFVQASAKLPKPASKGHSDAIERGVPVVQKFRRYPFSLMQVNESVLVRCETAIHVRRAVQAAHAVARYKNWTIKTTATDTGVRVWRVA